MTLTQMYQETLDLLTPDLADSFQKRFPTAEAWADWMEYRTPSVEDPTYHTHVSASPVVHLIQAVLG